ncbi:MAG: thioredoxin-like domain-containing protein [Bacteroidales bacterium]|nr:thioredoxin-like domain-containing protein [Bacteroidales bacterium]MDD4217288.1 thioredoxin-like domain-containing protein [Bacteroidales bacterium]MDY0140608.1 thioredoxin-like domain-containing protein [Bacteroidales bacterium]
MKLKNIIILLTICLLPLSVFTQNNIKGKFLPLAGQQVKLVGFQDFDIYTIDSTKVSEQGDFTLNYSDKNQGMAYLTAADNKAYFIVLAKENIQLKGEILSLPESIDILSGTENQLFVQYATEHPKREQALSAWVYLQKIYKSDSLFANHKKPQQSIETEMQRIKQEDIDFLTNLDSKSYISWFLPTRKLVSSVATIAQHRTEEIPATINAFRHIDYTDARLYKSGLLKDVIESHFWLLENMGQPLDTVYKEMSISIDFMLPNLVGNKEKFNQISKYLFDLLEKHSLYKAAEHLAIQILTKYPKMVNDIFAKQLETYRKMKKGNIASNIAFTGDVFQSGSKINTPKKLSDIQSSYKAVIFGASWCSSSTEELSQLIPLYKNWKSQDVEVIFVALDTDKTLFKNFTSVFPFISMCDYKKWGNKVVQDYYVYTTPTILLLDENQKIILQPKSISQLNNWVDWYLVQGNQ